MSRLNILEKPKRQEDKITQSLEAFPAAKNLPQQNFKESVQKKSSIPPGRITHEINRLI